MMNKHIKSRMRSVVLISVVFLGGLFFNACSSDNELGERIASGNAIQFRLFDNGAVSSTRATTDSNMKTSFEAGDEAGIFAVKDGEVLTNINNLCVTMDANGFWKASEDLEYSDTLTGATFYAYYPYSDSVKFDPMQSDPFVGMISSFTPSASQGTKTLYEAADIMTTGACSLNSYHAITLPLEHMMSLACVELPNTSYIFNNTDVTLSTYILEKAEDATFTLGGKTVSPYFDDATQSYRLIVSPNTTDQLKVSFTDNGELRSYTATDLSQVPAGQYAKYAVDGGVSLKAITLKVGDYYCADGTIVSQDSTSLPSNIIGVVMKLGTADGITSAHSVCTHAVVVGLADTATAASTWGNFKSLTSAESSSWSTWYTSYGLSAQSTTTNTSLVEDNFAEEGYEVTQDWLSVPVDLTLGTTTHSPTSGLLSAYQTWNATYLAPEVSTSWYVPSLRDWINIDTNLSTINTSLSKIKASSLSSAKYWSCNLRSSTSMWCYTLGQSALKARYNGASYSDKALYRFLLAF